MAVEFDCQAKHEVLRDHPLARESIIGVGSGVSPGVEFLGVCVTNFGIERLICGLGTSATGRCGDAVPNKRIAIGQESAVHHKFSVSLSTSLATCDLMVKVSRAQDIHIAARGAEVHAAFVITYFPAQGEPTDETTN